MTTCIWNKAGFILHIDWVKDEQIIRQDDLPVAQGVCSDAGDDFPYTIVLSIKDGEIADYFIKGAFYAAAAAVGVVAGIGASAATGGAAGAAAAGAAATAVAFLADKGIPNPKGIFYTGAPSQDRYLDVWGTIWDPQTGPGGAI